jgi:hypothetical protein
MTRMGNAKLQCPWDAKTLKLSDDRTERLACVKTQIRRWFIWLDTCYVSKTGRHWRKIAALNLMHQIHPQLGSIYGSLLSWVS